VSLAGDAMHLDEIDRRGFVGAVVLGSLGVARPALGQPGAKPARIGWLSVARYTETPLWPVFIAGMRDLGWVEGEHYVVEHRAHEGHPERLPALAAELVASKVDLIVASGTPLAVAAKAATSTIPIVFFYVGNPVGAGLVASLARPGGNATGTGGLSVGLLGKELQLLKEAVPKATRVGLLINPDFAGHNEAQAELDAASRALHLTLVPAEVRAADDIEPAFVLLAKARVDGVFVVPQPLLFREAGRIARLAIEQRLPAISLPEEFADAGALLSYGDRLIDVFRRTPFFIDRILKGAKPADLPVEQSTRFYLTVNLKTARAIGLAMPPTLMLRADRTIE
jgi:putative tryptophan/tyrosine transport system substrate-binding protein